jgi:hypothetical protein
MNEKIKETVSYMESMNEYSQQEVLRYIRGVYDGSQTVKRQYGLDREAESRQEPPKTA